MRKKFEKISTLILKIGRRSKIMGVMLVGLVVFQFASCKKFLDKKPSTNLTVPSSLNDLQALLDDESTMNTQRTSSCGEASADDYFASDDFYNSVSTFYQCIYTWRQYNYKYAGDWAPLYNPVYNANYCLETIDKIDQSAATQAQWNNVKGTALFFRSYYFLQLAWSFAKAYDESSSESDLGIVLRLTSDYNVPSVRSNVKQTYEQIIKDAKESIIYLPVNSLHPMRPSRPAAYGLLARTYLSMRLYDSAAKYANLCLQLKNQLMDYNSSGGDVINISDQTPFKPFNTEVIFHTTMNMSCYTYHPAAGANVDSVLYSSYNDNDLRKIAFFMPGNNYQVFKGNYAADQMSLFSGIATDEMYLIRAECYARSGNTASALNDLNMLLIKRWKAGTFSAITATDQNDALNKILIERRKELLIRGLRWPDLKRLNKEDRNIVLKRIVAGQTYTLSPNSDKYALELPFDIITLTGMPQNPGWQ